MRVSGIFKVLVVFAKFTKSISYGKLQSSILSVTKFSVSFRDLVELVKAVITDLQTMRCLIVEPSDCIIAPFLVPKSLLGRT